MFCFFSVAEPHAACSSVSVKTGQKAELRFQMKDVDLSKKYYIYIRKGTEPGMGQFKISAPSSARSLAIIITTIIMKHRLLLIIY